MVGRCCICAEEAKNCHGCVNRVPVSWDMNFPTPMGYSIRQSDSASSTQPWGGGLTEMTISREYPDLTNIGQNTSLEYFQIYELSDPVGYSPCVWGFMDGTAWAGRFHDGYLGDGDAADNPPSSQTEATYEIYNTFDLPQCFDAEGLNNWVSTGAFPEYSRGLRAVAFGNPPYKSPGPSTDKHNASKPFQEMDWSTGHLKPYTAYPYIETLVPDSGYAYQDISWWLWKDSRRRDGIFPNQYVAGEVESVYYTSLTPEVRHVRDHSKPLAVYGALRVINIGPDSRHFKWELRLIWYPKFIHKWHNRDAANLNSYFESTDYENYPLNEQRGGHVMFNSIYSFQAWNAPLDTVIGSILPAYCSQENWNSVVGGSEQTWSKIIDCSTDLDGTPVTLALDYSPQNWINAGLINIPPEINITPVFEPSE